MKKNRVTIPIPDHDDAALQELEEHGICICDYAKYENDHIVGYKQWGRGYTRYLFCESVSEHGR